jgi:DNA-binding IclR family transcriptional regulator
MMPGVFLRRALDRRNDGSREALLRRVRSEFRELPAHRLTCAQMRRLFGLRLDVCERVIQALLREGLLTRDPDDRYRLQR